ncbi:hypothetical protein AB4Y64_04575 [Lysobacter sp. TAF61]|uniref:hypothetical protein n=1 Tax=Lysobacter sp. TAF61 TaxID=3233072 RepID=UPI003F9A357E
MAPSTDNSIRIGIDGAGSADLLDNIAINEFGAAIGASMYDGRAIFGAPLATVERSILDRLAISPGSPVYLFGYSVGGDQVLRLANNLAAYSVEVKGLVAFDPHSPLNPLPMQRRYTLASDSWETLNFLQCSPYALGSNPFWGGQVNDACNVDLTSQGAVHTTIVRTALAKYEAVILSVLGVRALPLAAV